MGWLDELGNWLQNEKHPGDFLQRKAGEAGQWLGENTGVGQAAGALFGSAPSDVDVMNKAGLTGAGGGEAQISAVTPDQAEEEAAALKHLHTSYDPAIKGGQVGKMAGEFAGDPTNLAALGLGVAAPELAPLISAGFTAQLGGGAMEDVSKGNYGSAALQAAMAGLTGAHALGGAKAAKGAMASNLAAREAADAGLAGTFEAPKAVSIKYAGKPEGFEIARAAEPDVEMSRRMKRNEARMMREDDLAAMEPVEMHEGSTQWTPFKQSSLTTVDRNLSDANGNTFTYEVRNPDAKMAAKMRLENPETVQNFSELSTFINDIGAEADAIDLPARVATATNPSLDRSLVEPEHVRAGAGKFRGFIDDGGAESGGGSYGSRLHNLKDGSQPFFLNPRNIAKRTRGDLEFLLEASAPPDQLERAMAGVPPEVRQYAEEVRAGAPRLPELDQAAAAKLFARNVMYTTLHEKYGHWNILADHGPQAPGYKDLTISADGRHAFEHFPNQVSLDNKGMTLFEPANNAAVTAMLDEGALQMMKERMNQPEFLTKAGNWYKTALDDSHLSKVTKKKGRVAGRPETKAWDKFYAEEPAVSSTPPGEAPPGTPAGGEPFGPKLAPLAERIKSALNEQKKLDDLNRMKRRTLNTVRAEALRNATDEFASHRMSIEDYNRKRAEIMSGTYGLDAEVNGMALMPEEHQAVMEQIAAETSEDAFEMNRAQSAFQKLKNGERLELNEIRLLKETLMKRETDFMQDPLLTRMGNFFVNGVGGVRALMTSWDLSAAGRQALFASVMNPIEAGRAFKAQLHALKMSESEFKTFMDRLRDPMHNPYAELSDAAGLHFSESLKEAQGKMGRTEEAFSTGQWAEKYIPGVRRSEQAYIAYLNKIRVEIFNKSVRQLESQGVPLMDASGVGPSQEVRDVAYMVNTLSGRGEMSLLHISPKAAAAQAFEKAGFKNPVGAETFAPGEKQMATMHKALTSVFFAPRFAASQGAMLRDATMALVGGNLTPQVYAMYMKNVMGTVGVMSSVAGMIAATGAGTFEIDPRKKDFGVLKVGNTRYSLYGGLKPWAKLYALAVSDQYWSGRSQRPKEYADPRDPFAKTKTGEVGKFVAGKLSPAAGMLLEAYTGEDFLGRKSVPYENAIRHVTPMVMQTIYETIKAGDAEQLPLVVPAAVLGLGVNSYDERQLTRRNQR